MLLGDAITMSKLSQGPQIRLLSLGADRSDPLSVEDYLKSGGFAALKKAVTMKSEEVIAEEIGRAHV